MRIFRRSPRMIVSLRLRTAAFALFIAWTAVACAQTQRAPANATYEPQVGLPGINLKLRPKILALKPGTRVVSNTFTMGDWQPDDKQTVQEGCDGSWCTVLFWIVPARIAGNHKVPQGELALKQEFQMLSGTL